MTVEPTRARPHPPYDPELAPLAAAGAVDGHSVRREDISRLRELGAQGRPACADLTRGGTVWPEQRTIVDPDTGVQVPVVLLWPTTPYVGPRPVLLACHGGGLITGDAYSGTPGLACWVEQVGVVVASPGYRLAPEHPYPAALDDVMTTLAWLHREQETLGIDTNRLGIAGISAGAGLAAAACLRSRDEGLPLPTFQILQDAMLDDRHQRPSTYEHLGSGPWDRVSSQTSWNAYLDGATGGDSVGFHAAPGRAADEPSALAGLPPAFLDVGTSDLFRDDVLAYAGALAQAGVPTELHLWPGGWHGFSEMAPHTPLGRAANDRRTEFLTRMTRS